MEKSMGLLILALFSTAAVLAGETGQYAPVKSSAEFARMQALVGKWEGVSKHGNGMEEKVNVEYRSTSGGSAVVETLFVGTPHEMESVYFDQNGKLSMTHYCMLGNRPTLELQSGDSTRLSLGSTAQTRTELSGQAYMNGLVLEQPSKDELVQTWSGVGADGKPEDKTTISLKRI